MDEKGYSWPEAVLTLTILLVIFGTLLPLATHMTSILYQKKQSMRAAETAYQGMIIYNAYGIKEGTRIIEDATYDWLIEEDSICVSYVVGDKAAKKCVD